MGMIKAAMGDAILTSMWVFSMPLLGVLASLLSSYIGVQAKSLAALFITINVATLFVLTFSLIGAAMGGASFNPSTTVSLYAAGVKPNESLMSMAVRFPAQAFGGVVGALGILQLMPKQYKHILRGPSLKVDLHKGAVAEGVITFVFCFALLVIMLKGPKMFLVKVWLLAVATVSLVVAGREYTGPSMNPANAYGWAYVNNWHNTWELFYVYWICPFIGATLAAWFFKLFFKAPPTPPTKQKKED